MKRERQNTMKVYERKLFPKLFVQISFLNIIYEHNDTNNTVKLNVIKKLKI
jgi:hypothetical protein